MGKLISRKYNYKLYSIIITVILMVIFLLFLIYGDENNNSITEIIKWSWIGLLILVFIIYSNYKIFNSLFNSYNIYVIAFYLFTSGELLLLVLGTNYADIEIFKYSLFSNDIILKGAIYTCIGTLSLHLGLLLGNNSEEFKINNKIENEQLNITKLKAVRLVSVIICSVSIPIDLYVKLSYARVSVVSGYGVFYQSDFQTSSGILNTLALFSIPGCFLLASVYRNSKYKIIPLGYLVLSAGLYMLIGTRSYGTAILAALAWFYYVTKTPDGRKKKMSPINVIIIILMLYLFVTLLQSIKDVRSLGDKSAIMFITSFYKELTAGDMIKNSLAEYGYTIRPLLDLIKLDRYGVLQYKHGLTYIFALIMIIPSFLRGSIFTYGVEHGYLNIEVWLGNIVMAGFGIGYSLLAESYFNFGNYGWLALIPYGVLLGKLFSYKKSDSVQFSLRPAMVATMLALLIFSVRSQSQLLFKYIFLYYLIPQLFIKFTENLYKKRN